MEYEKLGLKTFEYTEHKVQDMENDIDPENNLYNSTRNHCEYYTEDGVISIIHLNSRSMNTNFSKIQYCLKQVNKKFTAIAISETWLNEEQAAMVQIQG